MSAERFELRSAVYLMLLKDGKILLLRRFNTGWMDGMYSLPAGHLDGNETVTDAMLRESREETGVEIERKDLQVVHTMHRNLGREYIDFFLTAKTWKGEPEIMEHDKCDDLSWFSVDALPENMVPSVRAALEHYQKGIHFSEFGWDEAKQ